MSERPPLPEKIERVHLMGICGVAMASLAGMLRSRGMTVTGADENVYPPMSDLVASMGIAICKGYRPENLTPRPDLVIIGNVIGRDNPEAQAVLERGIPYLSLPEALERLFLPGKRSLVIAGTHGKTTTSALVAWLLEAAGLKPSFMVGGVCLNFEKTNYRLGRGAHFVLEGDEYDTAFFDKGPKFLHYRPELAIITSIEFDHADIYADLDAVKASFARLIAIIPKDGLLLAYARDDNLAGLLSGAPCRVERYGLEDDSPLRAEEVSFGPGGTSFRLIRADLDLGVFHSPLHGRHNLLNTVAALGMALQAGANLDYLRAGLPEFLSVRRRQELRGEIAGVTLIEDFAHHPTAVRETLAALRAAYGGRRLVVAFEPRTNSSRRSIFQEDYARAFDDADICLIREAPGLDKIPEGERFSSERLVADLKARGREAIFFPDTPAIVEYVAANARPGDVVVTLSNGGFDAIQDRLIHALTSRLAATATA